MRCLQDFQNGLSRTLLTLFSFTKFLFSFSTILLHNSILWSCDSYFRNCELCDSEQKQLQVFWNLYSKSYLLSSRVIRIHLLSIFPWWWSELFKTDQLRDSLSDSIFFIIVQMTISFRVIFVRIEKDCFCLLKMSYIFSSYFWLMASTFYLFTLFSDNSEWLIVFEG